MDKNNETKKGEVNKDETKSRKERKIDLSLQEVARQLEEMEANYARLSQDMPAPARKMEERIQSLQKELDEISDKMLAHKLKRLASSKMLEVVGEKKQELVQKEKSLPQQKKPVAKPSDARPKKPADYQSSTFKCKSDLDQCLLDSKNALDKALCFTLFIRCALKG